MPYIQGSDGTCSQQRHQETLRTHSLAERLVEPQDSRCIQPAEAKFTNYIPHESGVKPRIFQIVEEIKRHGVFAENHPWPTRSYFTECDAWSLLSVLDELGYSEIKFLHKGNLFLTMQAVFRFSDVVIKLGLTSNPDLENDPCVREAEFFLDTQGEYVKMYRPRYQPYDQTSSSVDVLVIGFGSKTYTIASTQRAECSLLDKLNEISGEAQTIPCSMFIREVIELLFQILKLYQEVHLKNIALIRDPKRLMLLSKQEGHGCKSVSTVNFHGKSYALVVVSAAYTQKQRCVYHNTLLRDSESVCCDKISDMSKPVKDSIDKVSRPFVRVLTGFGIAALFADKKELVRLGHNPLAKKEFSADVSACRRDLQLIAATFIEVLAGRISQGDSDIDCSQPLVQEKDIDIEAGAGKIFAMIHSRALCNNKRDVDQVHPPSAESNPAVSSAITLEYMELIKLIWRLMYSKDITASDALESEMFHSHKKEDSWRNDPWRQQDIPDWTLLPELVTQNYWRRSIFPKCQHYYVRGGPYNVGGGKELHLRAVWLVYECVGDIITGNNAWQRTVRLAEQGNKGDVVAIYVCPLVCRSSSDFEFLDGRWTISIKSSDDWLFNGRTCGMFNPLVAVERQQVACYINSSKDKQGVNQRSSLQNDCYRKRFGLPKGQNCSIFYPHRWSRKISKDKFLANPWLGTIAFKLTSAQPRYAELAFPYDWNKMESGFHLKYMKETSTWRVIRLRMVKCNEL